MNFWAGLEMHIAIIAATIPALRPLWAKRVNQKQENKIQDRPKQNKHCPNSILAIEPHRIEADSPSSSFETRTTTLESKNEGDVECEARLSQDLNRVKKTSDISMQDIQKLEGKRIPEYSSLSDKERFVEDMV
ncbi:hypothetical protein MMC29_003272 [Sticta canariensis]|nr:hypothetical protein [Sticta canariensis]